MIGWPFLRLAFIENNLKTKNMTEQNLVAVYFCKCGESIQCACDPDRMDRSTKIEFTQAKNWGRKVKTITIEEYRATPFMSCDCFKKNT